MKTLKERLEEEGYVAVSLKDRLDEIAREMEEEAIKAEADLEAERLKYGY